MKRVIFGVIASLAFMKCAYAEDLLQVYQQALANDPVIQAAKATRDANMEALPQSVATLLPSIGATAQTTSVHTSSRAENLAQGGRGAGDDESFNQHDYTLTLTQPIFNFQSWMQVRAASAASKQAQATYNAALQDLIVRTSTAYFNVLNSQDALEYTSAQETAVANQLKQIKERYEVGLDTMTNVYQAQADYDGLVAARIAAQNNVQNSMEALRVITGQTYASLKPLAVSVPLISPEPASPELWIEAGEKNNWTLLAARYATQAAKENIRVSFAGHFPTVNAVGSYQNGNDVGVAPVNKTQWESQVGVQVSLPLFQGGAVVSQTRQAQDNYVAAGDQMESSRRGVVLQTQQAFNNVVAGISKIDADKIAVTSAVSALDSTQAGYKAGTKTLLDVLTAEQNVYQAKMNLSADLYGYINNTLALKEAAGSLSGADVVGINHWLQDKPAAVVKHKRKKAKRAKKVKKATHHHLT
ncbi:MAG: TolC family outer membrane protein [Gammaproteobacteria bacterium]|nr:TolC family outer membrane protein [Gammaproteobacteria bacterium]